MTTLDQVLADRWSCRAFRPDPVPEETLAEVFGLAQRTASWCNTQPWQVHLLSGDDTRRFAERLTSHVVAHPTEESPDYPLPSSYDGVYLARRRASGYALYESLGIDRADREGRMLQMLRNYSFFDAPHLAVVTSDRAQGVYGAVDCGGFVANLLNAAQSRGLGSIAQGALGAYAGAVRSVLGLPEDRMVVCGVALGFPEDRHPVNAFRTERAELSDVVTAVAL